MAVENVTSTPHRIRLGIGQSSREIPLKSSDEIWLLGVNLHSKPTGCLDTEDDKGMRQYDRKETRLNTPSVYSTALGSGLLFPAGGTMS